MPEVPRFGWRVLLASTALAAIAALGTVVVLSGGDDDGDTPSTVPTIPLTPDTGAQDVDTVSFTEFDGTEVALASLRGAPVVVNFFASTCTPCITEMPAFEEVHQQLGDQVTFLGLAMADRKDKAEELVERTGVTYRTAQDPDASVIGALGGTLLPTTVLIDAGGEIVSVHAGALTADELRALLADELGVHP